MIERMSEDNPFIDESEKPKEVIEKKELNEAEGIPGFERLDDSSKAFVLEIKHLDEISDTQYFDENPKIESGARAIQEGKNKKIPLWQKVFLDDKAKRRLGSEYWKLQRESPHAFATMYELLLLHLSELDDYERSKNRVYGNEMVYSKRTEYLADKMLKAMYEIDVTAILPDRFKDSSIAINIRTQNFPIETSKQLELIHRVLNMAHEFLRGGSVSAVAHSGGIRDLWRFAATKVKNVATASSNDWNEAQQVFLDKLSNINTRHEHENDHS